MSRVSNHFTFIMDERFVGVAEYSNPTLVYKYIPTPNHDVIGATMFTATSLAISIQKKQMATLHMRDLDAQDYCYETDTGTGDCNECFGDYTLVGGTCVPATINANCLEESCTTCDTAFGWGPGSTCVACPTDCLECLHSGLCFRCGNGTYMHNGSCIGSCPATSHHWANPMDEKKC